MKLGEIGEKTLKEIWQNHPDLIELRQRIDLPLKEVEACKACEYMNFCTGGCPAIVVSKGGTLNEINKQECYKKIIKFKDYKKSE